MNQTHYRSQPTDEQLLRFEQKQRTYVAQREAVAVNAEEQQKELETAKQLKEETIAAQEEQELLDFFAE